jgi:hypothetical protein
MKKFRNVKHNFGNEIHDKQNNYENNEFHQEPNVLKSMSVVFKMKIPPFMILAKFMFL